jgi:hypothetical protein
MFIPQYEELTEKQKAFMGKEFRIKTSGARTMNVMNAEGFSPAFDRKIYTSNERQAFEKLEASPPATAFSGKVYSLGALSIVSGSPRGVVSPDHARSYRTGEYKLGVLLVSFEIIV